MNTWCIALIISSFALALPASSAGPVVANRAPLPDEVGYRPADGSSVRLNPPSFIWLHEKEAKTYTIEWSRNTNFTSAESATGFRWNTYTHHTTLKPGTWYWRYRYTNNKGEVSNWSITRSVNVPEDATPFPMPTVAQQKASVPAGHPRLFMRPEDLPRLRDAAKTSPQFDKLRTEADRLIKAGPTPEPEHMGSATQKENTELIKYWWPNRVQAEKAGVEAQTLAFVYLMTRDKKYGDAAHKWVLHLASWNPDGPTNFKMNCEAGKVMLYYPARAYDWAWDTFTPEEHKKIQASILRRVSDAWISGEIAEGTGHLNRPYNSHGNRIWHKIAEPGITLLGELPEATIWVDYAINKFYSCYPIWSDDDGGWHEGVSYWAGYMGKAVTWLQMAQSAFGINGLKKPFFDQVGDYPLYITPPHAPNSGFGDLSFRPPGGGVGGLMEYHIRMHGNQPDPGHAAYWQWWVNQWGMKPEGGVFGFLYAANLPPLPAPKAPTDLPQSKIFRGIGVASLHTTLLDSQKDVHFLMKSSPFGRQSHGHNPHNAFVLNAYGDELLSMCDYRDLHGSKFHYQYVHGTRSHNSVLVNGLEQVPHSAAPLGSISDYKLNPEWDYIVGDASRAYTTNLIRFQRRVAFAKSGSPLIVIYDDLEAPKPSTFQFMLHGLTSFKVDEAHAQVSIERTHANATIRYLSPVPLAFLQTDGFQPPPSKEFPNQWHVEAATKEKRALLGMLTVIVPCHAGKSVEWSATRLESNTAIGARVKLGDASRFIAFRKHGVTGTATLDGQSFTTPVLVQ